MRRQQQEPKMMMKMKALHWLICLAPRLSLSLMSGYRYCGLLWCQPADDSTSFNDDDSSDEDNEELYNADEQDNRMDKNDNEEDKASYEVVPSVLLHLPTKDDKKIPQENKKYFDTKNYVHKDKYTLDQLLPKEMQLPPLSSIYKM
jgi:hypothetical protein